MPLAGLTAAGIAPNRIAELTGSSLWLLALAAGFGLVAIAVLIALGTPDRRDPLLRVTATLAGALLFIPTGLA